MMSSLFSQVKIVYEDSELIIFDKPHGLLTIPDRYDKSILTLKDYMMDRCKTSFVVHRLDMGTGGLNIFAKNSDSHRNLSMQFERGDVEKKYKCITEGIFQYPVTCMLPISKVNYHGKYKINFKSGRRCITSFVPETSFLEGGCKTLVNAVPLTGRAHQIRVHLRALKNPLLFDFLYNKKSEDKRLTLFCYSLNFTHPKTKKETSIEIDISDFMKECLK